jgi:hypothetical protein
MLRSYPCSCTMKSWLTCLRAEKPWVHCSNPAIVQCTYAAHVLASGLMTNWNTCTGGLHPMIQVIRCSIFGNELWCHIQSSFISYSGVLQHCLYNWHTLYIVALLEMWHHDSLHNTFFKLWSNFSPTCDLPLPQDVDIYISHRTVDVTMLQHTCIRPFTIMMYNGIHYLKNIHACFCA